MPDRASLDVLVTSLSLADTGGATLYVRDLALGLAGRRHSVTVYSPQPGQVGDELRDRGVSVLDRLDARTGRPDVIHANQTAEAVEAALRFPGVPMVFVCHGMKPWMATPPALSGIGRYVAISSGSRQRVLDTVGPHTPVEILPNGVDTDRFARRSASLPGVPRRALVFSNNATEDGYLRLVADACEQRSIPLDAIGAGVGREERAPEQLLGSYDVVFARGRAALEAISCGAAVVLLDVEGFGGMVTRDRIDELRLGGLGLLTLTETATVESIGSALDAYDPADAAAVTEHVRDVGSLLRVVDRTEEILGEVVEDEIDHDPAADVRAAAELLPRLSVLGYQRDAFERDNHTLAEHGRSVVARLDHHARELRAVGEQREAAREELDRIRASRWYRMRGAVLAVPGVPALGRRIGAIRSPERQPTR